MTATLTTPDESTPDTPEPVFLWGQGYAITARQIVQIIAAHLATYGDDIGPKGVPLLHVIDETSRYGDDVHQWLRRRSPEQVATIRARAEAIATDFFGPTFPTLTW